MGIVVNVIFILRLNEYSQELDDISIDKLPEHIVQTVVRRLRLLPLLAGKRVDIVVAAMQVVVCCIVMVASAFWIKYPGSTVRIELHVHTLQWVARNRLPVHHLLLLCC